MKKGRKLEYECDCKYCKDVKKRVIADNKEKAIEELKKRRYAITTNTTNQNQHFFVKWSDIEDVLGK